MTWVDPKQIWVKCGSVFKFDFATEVNAHSRKEDKTGNHRMENIIIDQ